MHLKEGTDVRKKKNGRKKCCYLMVIALACFVMFCCIGCQEPDSHTMQGQISETESIPYVDKAGITIDALFQFTGSNPDADLLSCENVAALTVTNTTDKHLEYAQIEIGLMSGTKLEFEVLDLAAGKTVNVFEKNNVSYEVSDECVSVKIDAEHVDADVLWSDKIQIQIEETNVTVTNISGDTLTNLVIHCHCMLDDTYFGGLTYKYPVEKIEAGESILVEAIDCYLGQAEVVRISQDNFE